MALPGTICEARVEETSSAPIMKTAIMQAISAPVIKWMPIQPVTGMATATHNAKIPRNIAINLPRDGTRSFSLGCCSSS